MIHAEAERALVRAVEDTDAFVALITAPTEGQQDAIRGLVLAGEAPGRVCDAFDLDSGSTWAEVVRAIAVRRGEYLAAVSGMPPALTGEPR